jgi:hypothetical protein
MFSADEIGDLKVDLAVAIRVNQRRHVRASIRVEPAQNLGLVGHFVEEILVRAVLDGDEAVSGTRLVHIAGSTACQEVISVDLERDCILEFIRKEKEKRLMN